MTEVAGLEIAVVAGAVIVFALAVHFRRSLRALAVNAILGILVLVVGQAAGVEVLISIWVILVCAIAGIPGAILVLLLAHLDIAFAMVV